MACACLLALLASTAVIPARGDTVYVRDTIYVPLRGGQSTEHRILHRGIRSGTPLERLEENPDTGYTLVRMADGLEGWVQTQYLVSEPIARDLLESTRSDLEAAEARLQQVLLRRTEIEEERQALAEQLDNQTAKTAELSEELASITELAANVIAIDEENKRLKAEQDSLLEEINNLAESNSALNDSSNQAWFLRGAGTVLVGLLFGFWLARRIYHRRGNGGWA